jgi:hypothetical protein
VWLQVPPIPLQASTVQALPSSQSLIALQQPETAT